MVFIVVVLKVCNQSIVISREKSVERNQSRVISREKSVEKNQSRMIETLGGVPREQKMLKVHLPRVI